MATAGVVIRADFPELARIRNAIVGLGDTGFAAAALGDAIEKALTPGVLRLRELTPLGPTGNLRAAVGSKVSVYARDGNAVGLIGYRRAGRAPSASASGGSVRVSTTQDGDRAFHQWFIEQGTRTRQITTKSVKPYARRGHVRRLPGGRTVDVAPHQVTKGQNKYIASSFRTTGPFQMDRSATSPEGVTAVRTDPAYPRAFFKASGQPIVIRESPVGGREGRPPLRTAFEQSQAQMAFILQQELRISLERALNALTFRGTGTL